MIEEIIHLTNIGFSVNFFKYKEELVIEVTHPKYPVKINTRIDPKIVKQGMVADMFLQDMFKDLRTQIESKGIKELAFCTKSHDCPNPFCDYPRCKGYVKDTSQS